MVVEAPRRADGRLQLLLVEPGAAVTSTGEVLVIRYEKLQMLAEQVCQEGAAIVLRMWVGRDGPELVELYRLPRPVARDAGHDVPRCADQPF